MTPGTRGGSGSVASVWRARARDGTPLFGQMWSPPEPRGLVTIIHGLGEHGGRYEWLAERFNEAGLAALAIDTRGHGQSGGRRGHVPSYEAVLDDFDLWLAEGERQFPGQPRILYGHSMGGSQVLYHALLRRPAMTAWIAASPALATAFQPPRWKTALGKGLDSIFPTLTLSNEVDPNSVSSDPLVVEAYIDDPLVHNRISVRFFNEWRRSVEEIFRNHEALPTPLLLMHGSADQLTSPAGTQKLAGLLGPRATSRIWEGCRHELHHEPPRLEIMQYVLRWLDRALAGRPNEGE